MDGLMASGVLCTPKAPAMNLEQPRGHPMLDYGSGSPHGVPAAVCRHTIAHSGVSSLPEVFLLCRRAHEMVGVIFSGVKAALGYSVWQSAYDSLVVLSLQKSERAGSEREIQVPGAAGNNLQSTNRNKM